MSDKIDYKEERRLRRQVETIEENFKRLILNMSYLEEDLGEVEQYNDVTASFDIRCAIHQLKKSFKHSFDKYK